MNIAENPFRILELPTTASSREIRRRVEELSVKATLGLAPSTLTEEKLRIARQALDDPTQRARYELLWILSAPEIAPPSVNPDDPQLTEQLLLKLQSLVEAGSEPSASLAIHDRAVLCLARFLADPRRVVELRNSLSDWICVFDSEVFWAEMNRRALAQTDPRIATEIQRLRDQLSSIILDAIAFAASPERLSDRYVAQIIETVRRYDLPPRTSDAAVRKLLEPVRFDARGRIEELEASLSRLTEGSASLATLLDAQTILRDKTRPQLQRLRSIDPTDNDAAIPDRYARGLAQLANATINVAEDWLLAIEYLKEALQTARSQSVLAELAVDQARLRRAYHASRMDEALSRMDWAGVAAHSELAAQYADEHESPEFLGASHAARRRDPSLTLVQIEERKRHISRALNIGPQSRTLSPNPKPAQHIQSPSLSSQTIQPAPRERRAGLWWSAGIVAVVAALVLLVVVNGGDREPSAGIAPAATAAPRRTPTPQPTPTPTCRDQVQALADDLDREGAEIEQIQGQMADLEVELNRHSRELDQLDTRYPAGLAGAPAWVIDRYNQVVDTYNQLLDQYRRMDAQENRMVADYNEKVGEHNALVNRC